MKKPKVIPINSGTSTKGADYSRKSDLTIEEVRASSIFRNISEEQALQVIEVLRNLALIACELYDNHIVVIKNRKNGVTLASGKTIHLDKPKKHAA